MTPPSTRSGSSAWSTIGRPVTRLYARAFRISRALLTMWPSSEKATAPACAMSAISESSWPFSPRVIVPIGWTRTTPPRRAAVLTHSTSEAVSTVGLVFGMAQMVVNPPAAAALVPDGDGLLLLEAWLPKVAVQIDEAGRDHHPFDVHQALAAGDGAAGGSARCP